MTVPERCGQGAFVRLLALLAVMVAVVTVMWILVSGWAD